MNASDTATRFRRFRRTFGNIELGVEMVIDEGARGHHAAAFSLLVGRDGKFRVMLDLLKQNSTDRYERTWEHDLFVTMLTIDREKLTRTDFSPEELQRIGQLVVGELAVLYRIQTEM